MQTLKRILYILYSVFIASPLFAIDTAFTAICIGIAALFGDTTYVFHYINVQWSKVTCWLYLLTTEFEGREKLDPKQSYIFIANHQGYTDIFIFFLLGWKFKWMMKDYIKKMPFIGFACVKSNQIFVGKSRATIIHAVRQAENTLKNGMSMVIFAEGTRSRDGKLGPFKRGAFVLAKEIDLPIVPITINGSFKILSRNDKWMHPGHMKMTVHDPITAEQRKSMADEELVEKVREVIASAIKN